MCLFSCTQWTLLIDFDLKRNQSQFNQYEFTETYLFDKYKAGFDVFELNKSV